MANVALIANIGDQTATQNTGSASALVPSGVVFPYAGSTTPTGWLVCDGTAYSQTAYPELFAALGSTYNTQINPTTGSAWAAPSAGQFRVPDLRGLFLRGEGTSLGGDAVSVGGHQINKTAVNGLASTFTGSAVTAANDNANHSHAAPSGSFATNNFPSAGQAYQWTGTSPGGYFSINNQTSTASANATHGHSVTAAGTNAITSTNTETRPVNRGVRYIIKI